MADLNTGHFLMGCRADNLAKLLWENRAVLDRERLPQTALLCATAAALAPAAGLEKLLYDRRIMAMPMEKDPVFVLGHWRSGTTYCQNMLSRDPQFGWADPVSTVMNPYCLLLRRALSSPVRQGIAGGRPMDNVQYAMDLPMEDGFALQSINPRNINLMMAFPVSYGRYLGGVFLEDLPPRELYKWRRDYAYILRKLNYVNHGKQLVLKSPDHTGHVRELWMLCPGAKFLNIHRDPYATIRSFVHMLLTQMDILHLTPVPENAEELVEDVIVGVFERMYRSLFAIAPAIPEGQFAEVAYADFCADPVGALAGVYERFGLDGFDTARPHFEAYAAAQGKYQKNALAVSPRLRRKINARLDFYFEHYGYPMTEADK